MAGRLEQASESAKPLANVLDERGHGGSEVRAFRVHGEHRDDQRVVGLEHRLERASVDVGLHDLSAQDRDSDTTLCSIECRTLVGANDMSVRWSRPVRVTWPMTPSNAACAQCEHAARRQPMMSVAPCTLLSTNKGNIAFGNSSKLRMDEQPCVSA